MPLDDDDNDLPPAPASPPRERVHAIENMQSGECEIELRLKVCHCPDAVSTIQRQPKSNCDEDLEKLRWYVHKNDTPPYESLQLHQLPVTANPIDWLPMRVAVLKPIAVVGNSEQSLSMSRVIHVCDPFTQPGDLPVDVQPHQHQNQQNSLDTITTQSPQTKNQQNHLQAASSPSAPTTSQLQPTKSVLKKSPPSPTPAIAPNTGSAADASHSGSEIIVISDEFRRQAIDSQGKAVVLGQRRKWLRLMKLQREQLRAQRLQKQLRLHNDAVALAGQMARTMCGAEMPVDDCGATGFEVDCSTADVGDISTKATAKHHHSRAATVPTISRLVAAQDSNHSHNGNAAHHRTNHHLHRKQLVVVSDDFRRDACRQTDGVVVIVDDAVMSRRRQRQLQQMRRRNDADDGDNANSRDSSSVDDGVMGNKLTTSAFRSYDEDDEDLERKQLMMGGIVGDGDAVAVAAGSSASSANMAE